MSEPYLIWVSFAARANAKAVHFLLVSNWKKGHAHTHHLYGLRDIKCKWKVKPKRGAECRKILTVLSNPPWRSEE